MDTELPEAPKSKGLSRRNIFVVSLLALLVLGGGGYYFFARSSQQAADVVARVGDEVITRHQVDVRVRQLTVRAATGQGLSTPEDALFDRSLSDLINESLVYQDALAHGFSADQEEANARYNAVRDKYDSEEAFLKRMEMNLLTPKEFRENIVRQMVLFAYLEDLRRQEVQAVLNAHPAQKTENGTTVTVTADEVMLTQEDIDRIVAKRAAELKKEVPIEVYLDE